MSGNNFLEDSQSGPKKTKAQSGPKAVWTDPSAASSEKGSFALEKSQLHDYHQALAAEKGEKKSSEKILASDPVGAKNLLGKFSALNKAAGDAARTLKTNLVKEDVTTFVDWKRNLSILLAGLVCLAVLFGGFYGYLLDQQRRNAKEAEALGDEINRLKIDIEKARKEASEADAFGNNLKTASSLLEKHIYWSNFFKFIEENTLADTFYGSAITGTLGGDFSLQAKAKSFQAIDDQVRVFRSNGQVKKAEVSSAKSEDSENGSASNISYTLVLGLDPGIFYKKSQE